MPPSAPGFWTALGTPSSVDWCEANYAVVLGLFLEGLAEAPDREEYGLSQEDHNRILQQVA